jgi:GNAT superfamily N-acetyltransferase
MQLTYRADTAFTAAPLPRVGTLSASRELTVRSATAADTADVLELIGATYARENKLTNPDYWQWKHHANPFGTSPCLVAESNGRIVGVRVFLRWNWRSGTRDVRSVRAVDTATHPDWQGRGIFSRLTMRLVEDMQREGVSFVFNTPNSNSMPGYLKMGWTAVTRIPLWIRPVGVSSLVRHALRNEPPTPPVVRDAESAAHVLSHRGLGAFLLDVTPADQRYHTARTVPFLRWRYAAVPGESYWARFETNGDAGALIIARGKTRGRLRALMISELMVTPSSRGMKLGRALLADLARTTDADFIAACTAPGTIERRVLARSAFFPAPRLGPHFTARRLDLGGLDPSDWHNWRCSIGDLELF